MSPMPRTPNLQAQRAAMQQLNFLVGKWAGEARVLRGPGDPVGLIQTEEAHYKLDGLILLIEGIGRSKSTGELILQALGVISYDDERAMYQMRAFNDGRFLETGVRLSSGANELTWGFSLGEIKTNSILNVNDQSEWTELHQITIGIQPPKKLMEVIVRRQG
jgi:hypothetical protein